MLGGPLHDFKRGPTVTNSSGRSVAVVGGGPAGLMAAEVLAAGGAQVTVYDRMPSLGRKLLLAGRGGLNLTHSEELADFLSRYGGRRDRLEPAIEALPPQSVRAWCEELGQPTFVGSSGRIFPKSMKASPLLRAWLARLSGSGVAFRTRCRWTGWDSEGRLVLATPDGNEAAGADATVLALGGASWPRLGSTGDWVPLLAARGVGVAPLRPANCGFLVAWSETFRSRFEGQPLKRVALTCGDRTVRGEALVTAGGIEGGAVYALAASLRDTIDAEGAVVLHVDLRPDLALVELAGRLSKPRGKQSLSTFLRKAANFSPVEIGLMHETAVCAARRDDAGGHSGAGEGRPHTPHRRRADRHGDLHGRRHRMGRSRRAADAAQAARRVRRRRDARLGGADRRLSLAGVLFNGRARRPRRPAVACRCQS